MEPPSLALLTTDKEAGLELGLGLSLGNNLASAWSAAADCKRILTAQDFPSGTKRERTLVATATAAADDDSSMDEGSASAAVSSQVVGWPPVRAYRMNTLFSQSKPVMNAEDSKGDCRNGDHHVRSKKKTTHNSDKNDTCRLAFVKVNMDCLPIGRKVDLSIHRSYETLAKTLEDMFFEAYLLICNGKKQPIQSMKLLEGSSEFALTYEDKEGDWMLVGDVPWGMFLSTVKRLRIMQTDEANGLSMYRQIEQRNEMQKMSKPI